MSYCRWSSDDWACDIYAYENVSGCWTIHVAGNRVQVDIPKTDLTDSGTWFKTHQAQMKFLETAERKPIGLPYDGETYDEPDLESFKERLTMLREAGYNVPEYVFETIDEEIKERPYDK